MRVAKSSNQIHNKKYSETYKGKILLWLIIPTDFIYALSKIIIAV